MRLGAKLTSFLSHLSGVIGVDLKDESSPAKCSTRSFWDKSRMNAFTEERECHG